MMTREEDKYSLLSFFRDRALLLISFFLFLLLMTITLIVLTVPIGGIVFLDLIGVVGLVVFLLYAYNRDWGFWSSMSQIIDNPEAIPYFQDVVEEPNSLDARIAYYGILSAIRSDQNQIALKQQSIQEHSEYFELWVHEVKTPLATAQLISKRIDGADKHLMQRELERIQDLVDQALFAARMKTLQHDYLIREVNLASIAKEACKSHMNYLTSLGMSLSFDIDPNLKVFTDKTWLEFIITQIVINAAKYDAHSIQFSASTSDAESSSSHTVLQIKDDGCGIPAADVPRVFDRGFTGEVGRSHGSATGMGLYLAAQMCEQMGLGIMIASEEGVGTRVCITFPHDKRRKATGYQL